MMILGVMIVVIALATLIQTGASIDSIQSLASIFTSDQAVVSPTPSPDGETLGATSDSALPGQFPIVEIPRTSNPFR